MLAGKPLVDEKIFLIVPHGIAEIDRLDSPAVAFKLPVVKLGCTRHSRNKFRSALVGTKIRRRLKKEDLSRLLVLPFSSVDKSLTL